MTSKQSHPSYFERRFNHPISIHPFSFPPLDASDGHDSSSRGSLPLPSTESYGLYSLRSIILNNTQWKSPSTKCLAAIHKFDTIYPSVSVSKSGTSVFTVSNEKCYIKTMSSENNGKIVFYYNNGVQSSEYEALDFAGKYHERFVATIDFLFRRWTLLAKYKEMETMESAMRSYLGDIPSIVRQNFGKIEDLLNLNMSEDMILRNNGAVRELSEGWYINFYCLREKFMNVESGGIQKESINISQMNRIMPEFIHGLTNVSTRTHFGAHLSIVANDSFLQANYNQKEKLEHPLVYMLYFDRPISIPFQTGQDLMNLIFNFPFPKARPTDYPSLEELLLQTDVSTRNEVCSAFQIGDLKYTYRNLLTVNDENTIPAIEITHLYFRDPTTLPKLLNTLRVVMYTNELFCKCFSHPIQSVDSLKEQTFLEAHEVQVRLLPPYTISITTTIQWEIVPKICNIRVYIQPDLTCKLVIMIGNYQDEALQEECQALLNKYHNIPLLIHFLVTKLGK